MALVKGGIDQPDTEEVVKPSKVDKADAEEEDVEETERTAGGDEDEETTEEEEEVSEAEATELISKARFDELKADPEKLHKELVKAANAKFREAATERKQLKPYTAFIAAMEADPRKALTALGKQLGMKIGDEKDAEQVTEDVNTKLTKSVKDALGPEFEELADRLIPAIRVVAENLVEQAMKPVNEKTDGIIRDSAAKSSEAAMNVFKKNHPDWEKHEEAMVTMSAKLPPGEGMTEAEYLEDIFYLVTREKSKGEGVKKVVDRMKNSAKNASKDASTVSDTKVTARPIKPPTFKEAAAAAIRGERFE